MNKTKFATLVSLQKESDHFKGYLKKSPKRHILTVSRDDDGQFQQSARINENFQEIRLHESTEDKFHLIEGKHLHKGTFRLMWNNQEKL